MEPFRILIDRCVKEMNPTQFTARERHLILESLNQEVLAEWKKQTVLNAVKIYVRNTLNALNEGKTEEIQSFRLIT